MSEISRRSLITGVASLALSHRSLGSSRLEPAKPRSSFRFIHFTDLHIQPELGAVDGVALAVSKIQTLRPRPDFILTGGDHVMDALRVSRPRADLQFKLFAEALRPLEMPTYSTVGNHDIYGWSDHSPALAQDPLYGKRMFEEHIAKAPIYRSFDFGGWHFIILDSIQSRGKGWYGAINDSQLTWLKDDLSKAGSAPKVVMTHVPVLTLAPQYIDGTTKAPNDGFILANGKDVKELIQGKNVKVVLQGHTHVVEDCDYLGTRYVTGGAVCGDWWKGYRLGVHPEGFMVYDVKGSHITNEYVTYGWKARSI